MIDMVADAKTGINQLGHSWACPEVGRKSRRFRSLKKFLFKLEFFLIADFRWPPGGHSGSDGFWSIFQESGFPSADAPAVNLWFLKTREKQSLIWPRNTMIHFS
jgi:hypothetical protein